MFAKGRERFLLCVATALALSLAAPAGAANATIEAATDGFVRPAYKSFAAATASLAPEIDQLCAAPSPDGLATARNGFRTVTDVWSAVEIIRFGPVTEENRLERILYWPDRKGIGLKQVQAALAKEDPSATDANMLTGKSVAMQGLGALEFVLFGTGSDDQQAWAKSYRCRYALAIAGNLSSMAQAIAKEWDDAGGFRAQWTGPGAANPLYRTDAEAMTELLNVFVHGTEMVRDVRLNGFLGDQPDKDKPKQAIYWRSQSTAKSLAANIGGLKKLFDAADLAALATGENQYLGASINFEFTNAAKALEGAKDQPIDAVLADLSKRAKLDYFRVVTSSLSDLIGTKLAGALGLSAGFSSLDGD